MAEQLKPAVVNISTTQVVKGPQHGMGGALPRRPSGERDLLNEFLERFFGDSSAQREVRRDSLGSGFIIDKNGYIVTKNHVVENATDIKVSLADVRYRPRAGPTQYAGNSGHRRRRGQPGR